MVKEAFEDSDGACGYRRVQACLEKRGVRAGTGTVMSMMRAEQLKAVQSRAKVRTTVPAVGLDARPGLVGWDFIDDKPGRQWCGGVLGKFLGGIIERHAQE